MYIYCNVQLTDDLLTIIYYNMLQTAQAHQTAIEKEVNSLSLAAATVITSIPSLHKQGKDSISLSYTIGWVRLMLIPDFCIIY